MHSGVAGRAREWAELWRFLPWRSDTVTPALGSASAPQLGNPAAAEETVEVPHGRPVSLLWRRVRFSEECDDSTVHFTSTGVDMPVTVVADRA